MSAYWTSVERPHVAVKPIKRPRGPQALTFLFTFLQPATFAFLGSIPEQPMHAATRKHPPTITTTAADHTTASPHPQQVENVFIDALVQACMCRQHVRMSPSHGLLSKPAHLYRKARRRCQGNGRQVRQLHRSAAPARAPSQRTPLSREEYLSMLDWYREPFSTQATCIESEPFRPPSDSPELWSSGFGSQLPWPNSRTNTETLAQSSPSLPEPLSLPVESEPLVPTEESIQNASTIHDISKPQVVTDLARVLSDDDCTHEAAFDAYSALPYPGVSHLSYADIRLLFRRLSTIEKKTKSSLLRYLSVVDDMKATNLPMIEAEWNSAIAFCGQCFARITAADMESALLTWKDMEEEAAVKGGNVTFNILFDMAAKAGKFVLAEMILKEMETRQLSINRYARVGFIYYHGLRADGDGVRRAYREFVEAGEVVDTVVMNCVIASLIRAGEAAAAEQVYERMKRLLMEHTDERIPTLKWKETRDLGRLLDWGARRYRSQPTKLQQLRDDTSFAPNIHTYTIFVEHHASTTGELRRIVALLTEMQYLGVPMHARIFLKIFKGFAFHGGIRYTSWTKTRLESVWNALLDALDTETDLRIMKWLVIWAVKAFQRCAGKERTLEVWAELRERWKPDDCGELEVVMTILKDVLNGINQR